MAYTKLTLQDYKDKWNAEKANHLQDGIAENDSRLNSLFESNTSLSDDSKRIIKDKLDIQKVHDSEIVNSIVPLWSALLAEGGKTIMPPALSFDGNPEGKPVLSLGLSPSTSSVTIESSVGYIRIGDPIDPCNCIMTFGGAAQLTMIMYDSEKMIDYVGETAEAGLGLQMMMLATGSPANLAPLEGMGFDEYYCESQKLVESEGMLTSTIFPSYFEGPVALCAHEDFIYMGKKYPRGFYVKFINSHGVGVLLHQMGGETLTEEAMNPAIVPAVYINNIWPLNALTGCLPHIQKDPELFENSYTFICDKDKIIWNKNNGSLDIGDASCEGLRMIATEPGRFTELCKRAESINITTNLGIETEVNLQVLKDNGMQTLVSLGGNVGIVQNLLSSGDKIYAPGVYVSSNITDLEIQFVGVDVNSVYKKIDHHYYDCPAYEESGFKNLVYSINLAQDTYIVDNVIFQGDKKYLIEIDDAESYICSIDYLEDVINSSILKFPGVIIDSTKNIRQIGENLIFTGFDTSSNLNIKIYEYKEHIIHKLNSKFMPEFKYDLVDIMPIIPLDGAFVTTNSAVEGISEIAKMNYPIKFVVMTPMGLADLVFTFNYWSGNNVYQGVSTIYFQGAIFDVVCEILNSEAIKIGALARGA